MNRASLSTSRVRVTDLHCSSQACNYVGASAQRLYAHYRTVHKEHIIQTKCLYSKNCDPTRIFRTFAGLKTHIARKHKTFLKEKCDSGPVDSLSEGASTSSDINKLSDYTLENVESEAGIPLTSDIQTTEGNQLVGNAETVHSQNGVETNIPTVGCEPYGQLRAGIFVLNLLAERKLTQVSMQSVINHTSTLVMDEVTELLELVKTKLAGAGCEGPYIDLVSEILENYKKKKLFHGLQSQYCQIKYFINNFGLLMPEKILLTTMDQSRKRKRAEEDIELHSNHIVYISILKQLQRILNFPDVYEEINRRNVSRHGLYDRFKDGASYKRNKLFQMHPNALQIHLYIDEVQLCNAVGSYDKKMVFIYFSLANLHPKYRSNYQSINLVSMFPHELVSSSGGYNVLLRPVVDDLKILEQGYDFSIGNKIEKVFGTLTAVVADNLASHQVAGFQTNFSKAFRKCRTCLAVNEDIQTKFCDSLFTHRTVETHAEHCESVKTPGLEQHFSTLYGVKSNSILDELVYFKVIGGMVPDIMHDILEGTLPKVISLFLKHCIKIKKYFTLGKLNEILKFFKYGSAEIKDRPSPVLERHLRGNKIHGSATQKWLLGVNLPIMIGSLIDRKDSHFLNYCSLLKICRIVFAPSATTYDLMILDDAVYMFMRTFKKCYPKTSISFKMHNLTHYSRFIGELGPLTAMWCMRYEAKHAYFKSLQKQIGNWINCPWTLSYRHQQYMCQKFLSCQGKLLSVPVSMSPKTKRVSVRSFPIPNEIAQALKLNSITDRVETTNYIIFGTTLFKKSKHVVLCPGETTRASFGLITDIIVLNNRYLFLCKLFRVVKFCNHYQAFCLKETRIHKVVSPSELVEFRSYSLHTPGFVSPSIVKTKKYVISKTNIHKFVLPPIRM